MKREEMIRRIKAGDKPIDVVITKWENVLEGTGKDEAGNNCAFCYVHHHMHTCGDCDLNFYGVDYDFAIDGGCGGFYRIDDMTYIDKQYMLSFLYAVKEEMIKDGVY